MEGLISGEHKAVRSSTAWVNNRPMVRSWDGFVSQVHAETHRISVDLPSVITVFPAAVAKNQQQPIPTLQKRPVWNLRNLNSASLKSPPPFPRASFPAGPEYESSIGWDADLHLFLLPLVTMLRLLGRRAVRQRGVRCCRSRMPRLKESLTLLPPALLLGSPLHPLCLPLPPLPPPTRPSS